MSPELLSVLGFILTLLLGINAWFIRDLVQSIKQVEIQTATLLEKSLNNSEEISILRERVHKLTNDISAKFMAIEIKITEMKKN